MPASARPARRLARLFKHTPVVDMDALEQAVPGRSRRSLYRDLAELGYLASFSHAGRYYTLRASVPFDAQGLWFHQGVGFSRHGTLKATCVAFVEDAEAGRTQRELADQLHVRVHNTLLDLVEEGRIARRELDRSYLYVSADAQRSVRQIEGRRRRLEARSAAQPLSDALIIEVLLELVRAAKELSFSATGLARRLAARGVNVTVAQVQTVLHEYGIGKKGRHSRSRPSRR